VTTVHLVPYSRTDVGFKKTVDEYFSGTNQATLHASVMTILDSVVDALSKDPKRRYSFSDVKYLHMWYTRTDKESQ
jgi:hypothetical protein